MRNKNITSLFLITTLLLAGLVSAYASPSWLGNLNGGITGNTILTDGLIAYYNFENNTQDQSGNSHDGVIGGAPQFVSGAIGNSISFDGIDDYVEVPDAISLTPAQISISYWLNPSTLGEGTQNTISKRNSQNIGSYTFASVSSTTMNHWLYVTKWHKVDLSYTNNEWQHIVITYDGETIKGYKNAAAPVLNTAPSGALNDDTGVLRIGKDSELSNNRHFTGKIDEVRIYNRVLSAEEVLQLYNEPSSTCGNNITEIGEICDGNTQICTAQGGYSGAQNCLSDCSGFDLCTSTEFCGDTIINGNEQCDDGNTLGGDGCAPDCTIESTQGIVAQYNFENNVQDQSGNSHDGVIEGAPQFINGAIGKALKFNGIDDSVTINDSADLRLGTEQSVQAWIKIDSAPVQWARIIGKGTTERNYGLWLASDRDILFQFGKAKAFCNFINSIASDPNPDISDAEWHQIVGTYNGVTGKIYLDSAQIYSGSCSKAVPTSQSPLTIGSQESITGSYFDGSIDEVRVYNKVLSPEEIQSLFQERTEPLSIFNLSISIATLKDNYNIGEPIQLTDPPDPDEEIASFSHSTKQTPQGYIIKLKEKPILVQKKELEKKAAENEQFIKENPLVSTLLLQKFFSLKSADVPSEVKKHREKLLNEHAITRQKIKDKFSSSLEDEVFLYEFQEVFNGFALNISAQESAEIAKLPEVENVYPNLEVYATLDDSIPLINADYVWQLDAQGSQCSSSELPCLTGEGIKIAIIDTGVDYNHSDLGGCFGAGCKVLGGYDFVNNDNNPIDDNGHGTYVASIAAGNGALNGVAPDANILAYKVLNDNGVGFEIYIVAGIEQALTDGADIISMSLGAPCLNYDSSCGPDDFLSQSVDNAVDAGVVVSVSAGNCGPSGSASQCPKRGNETIMSPGTARKAITIGATNKNDVLAGFSSRGPVNISGEIIMKPDVVAPGVNICAARQIGAFPEVTTTCLSDNAHVVLSGTSASAPHVSGQAALLLQKNPQLTPDEVKQIIKNTTIPLPYSENEVGTGRINALASITNTQPFIPRPQSKIVNNENTEVIATLKIKTQRSQLSQWVDYQEVYAQEITLPAAGLIKLDQIFNPLNATINETGAFRVYTSLTNSTGEFLLDINNQPLEANWEFLVS